MSCFLCVPPLNGHIPIGSVASATFPYLSLLGAVGDEDNHIVSLPRAKGRPVAAVVTGERFGQFSGTPNEFNPMMDRGPLCAKWSGVDCRSAPTDCGGSGFGRVARSVDDGLSRFRFG